MASVSSMETVTPHAPPSLPPSPTEEEDLTRLRPWDESSRADKRRKGKQRAGDVDSDYSDVVEDSASSDTDQPMASGSSYPPMREDEFETKRVEETLRRWEVAERQRRKAARQATTHEAPSNQPPSSLVDGVSRRASSLWTATKSSSKYLRHHHSVLKSRDSIDSVPLEALSPIPDSFPSNSRAPSSENPFETPAEAVSPFTDSYQMQELSDVDQQTVNSSDIRHPPPSPLDLPPPRISPLVNKPPPATRSPQTNMIPSERQGNAQKDVPSDGRWWHEWLCGCGEDRESSTIQGGRTNPFE
ncbi:uncharacterized protein BT62DRAFT_931836 [Guyanagaster necrorhizus]|uniref:Uncharacterized protein n=1 Tax=Guyanagaster necrorhizus TaxID=856835 RepID=A0A9P8AU02_9AGAR|nr:uncharacterized protein BT62DRAFT_931836 [Guyanagaster necrorhizus MCA 3950]KAG7446392.1 hypothetical protein BT62DRAFT_931836 [Guyanagaster necrorhizus MCA 3950]